MSSQSTDEEAIRNRNRSIKPTGLVPWDDLLQPLGRSAQTDFAWKYRQHGVSRWIGHSRTVSEKRYLMSDNFVLDVTASGRSLLRAAHSDVASPRTDQNPSTTAGE